MKEATKETSLAAKKGDSEEDRLLLGVVMHKKLEKLVVLENDGWIGGESEREFRMVDGRVERLDGRLREGRGEKGIHEGMKDVP